MSDKHQFWMGPSLTTVLTRTEGFKGKSGIYCFLNKINGNCYIGSSVDLRRRIISDPCPPISQISGVISTYSCAVAHELAEIPEITEGGTRARVERRLESLFLMGRRS